MARDAVTFLDLSKLQQHQVPEVCGRWKASFIGFSYFGLPLLTQFGRVQKADPHKSGLVKGKLSLWVTEGVPWLQESATRIGHPSRLPVKTNMRPQFLKLRA